MVLVSQSELVQKAIALKVVSFPTDTVPALGVAPEKADLIFELKQRSLEKPLILMTGDITDIWEYVEGSHQELKMWQEMAHKYLPGALTMVLPASSKIPVTMNPLNPTSIGVRVPNHTIAREILRQTGPLATTSANLSGEDALTDMGAIALKFPTVAVLNHENKITEAIPSTVIKWQNDNWQILRQGKIII
ncbi:L-threonylcarbamoyladenylate synthase [Cyanobacterium stanieri LEGE 03274]|uniref:L-threonylcarbamoyladenylate synthase n=1 Tax=Cyanobacterium stanieri LEGE 03274 TaxID=1828756 RepID=A0ABR9V295_9CHRO|nr:L-threonylcarbamoyladenylate synthase [Cyanobacterium stanieri]MBE9221679.1 L-threonylcarbamoyladenylate synthase [Cyanobacterium stanieri LEGE 03274]